MSGLKEAERKAQKQAEKDFAERKLFNYLRHGAQEGSAWAKWYTQRYLDLLEKNSEVSK